MIVPAANDTFAVNRVEVAPALQKPGVPEMLTIGEGVSVNINDDTDGIQVPGGSFVVSVIVTEPAAVSAAEGV